MTILGICVFFNAVVLVTTAIMQAHGNVILPVVNMALAGGIRLLSVYILARNPKIGIVGAPISNLMCYMLIFLLNLLSIHHLYNNAPQILPNVLRPLLSGLLMGACAYGCYQAMLTAHIGSRLLLCAVPVSVGAIVYLAAVIFLKVLRKEDCMLLPKGEKIARWLHLEN